jgi:hypothetical protein
LRSQQEITDHNEVRFNRVLLVGYFFSPYKTIGALRLQSLANELARFSKEIVVLSSSNSLLVRKEPLPLAPNIRQALVPTLDYHTIRAGLYPKKQSKSEQQTPKTAGSFSRLLSSFPINLLMGEGALLYVLVGIAMGMVKLRRTDLIVSSYRPFADHFIARVLKIMKPTARWVADYRDIHVDRQQKSVFWPDFQDWVHRWLLRPADVVTVVSEGYLASIQRYHPKSLLLRNGYSDFTQQLMEQVSPRATSRFCIAYCGMLYDGRRSADALWGALRGMIDSGQLNADHLELVYAGREGAQWMQQLERYGLAEYGVDLGEISLQDAFSLQKGASLNLLLSWATPQGGTFPAKFYEYLLAERPILMLITGSRDHEWEQLFHSMPLGAMFYEQHNEKNTEIQSFLASKYNEWLQLGAVKQAIPTESRYFFYWKNNINQLIAQL